MAALSEPPLPAPARHSGSLLVPSDELRPPADVPIMGKRSRGSTGGSDPSLLAAAAPCERAAPGAAPAKLSASRVHPWLPPMEFRAPQSRSDDGASRLRGWLRLALGAMGLDACQLARVPGSPVANTMLAALGGPPPPPLPPPPLLPLAPLTTSCRLSNRDRGEEALRPSAPWLASPGCVSCCET